jgi:NAD(P)H dehydrogenase (quinone)
MRVLVVVASQTGRTRRMAEALAEGAREAGAEALLRDAAEVGDAELLEADAIVLGSGVHMGGVEAPMRGFLEGTSPLWLQGRLVGKLGAAFVSAGAGGRGGGELALLSLLAALAEHGLLLVSMPNRLEGFAAAGCHWGPVAWTSPREGEAGPTAAHLAAARAHGRHVADCTARWLNGRPPPRPPRGDP